ncbi:hypothetical protein ACFVYE_46410 [Streptomyces sp. NPDC058239]|uniref:hypothetical protein n=1 Tax=unclassified Streptomyces TaxID=2593676 RepID=UPI0036574DB4
MIATGIADSFLVVAAEIYSRTACPKDQYTVLLDDGADLIRIPDAPTTGELKPSTHPVPTAFSAPGSPEYRSH